LQDRDYYQSFSYVIRSTISIDNYRKAIKDLVHPSGMKLFGGLMLEDMNDNGTPSDNADDSVNSNTKTKTYVKTANTINISYVSHGLNGEQQRFTRLHNGRKHKRQLWSVYGQKSQRK
jgi:hypothetical protein